MKLMQSQLDHQMRPSGCSCLVQPDGYWRENCALRRRRPEPVRTRAGIQGVRLGTEKLRLSRASGSIILDPLRAMAKAVQEIGLLLIFPHVCHNPVHQHESKADRNFRASPGPTSASHFSSHKIESPETSILLAALRLSHHLCNSWVKQLL